MRDQIATDIAEIMTRPDIAERNRTFGYEVPKLSPQAFTDLIARETGEWREIIKEVGLKLD